MIKICKLTRLTIYVALFLITTGAFGQAATINTVFFSEYIEGSGIFNQALEIYNGSGSDIDDLSEFSISIYRQGGSVNTIRVRLSGSLNAGEVYVIARRNASSAILNQADAEDFDLIFSGGDAIALLHNGEIVDIIGNNGGTNPTDNSWSVAGTVSATTNHTLVRKQNITQGNATVEDSFGTTLDNSEWIVYDQDEFRYLGSHCELPPTQATNVVFGTTDDTSIVVTWTKGAGDKSLVVVKAGSAVDAMPAFGRDYTTATDVFSDAGVTLDTDNVVVYSNDSNAQTVTVTGLIPGTIYYVAVYAYNASRFCYNTASPARSSKRTTTSNDTDSDITAVAGGETANIAYDGFQAASGLAQGTSASLFTFSINDKGTTDGSRTTVTAISFDITNHQYLRKLALFDGTAGGASLIKELDVAGNTLSFTELDIQAASRMTKAVNVRATFVEDVVDGAKIGLTISDVTANPFGSIFAAPNGGGAATDLTPSGANAIEVSATELTITAPAYVQLNTPFRLTVTAVDGNNNIDVAARQVTLATTGAGTLTSTGLGPVAMTDGFLAWDDLQYDGTEIITLSVTDTPGTLSGIKDINVFELLTSVFFSEYIEGSGVNKALEIYNGSGSEVDLSEFSIVMHEAAGLNPTYTYRLSGSLAAGEVYVIGRSGADPGISSQANELLSFLSVVDFVGRDLITLLHGEVIVDWIGRSGYPGLGWSVAGTADATRDHTLVRKQSITEGNATPLRSFGMNVDDSEWIVYGVDEFSYLGSHCNLPSQALGVVFGATEETSMVVNWTKGDGDNSLVVVKAVSAVDAMPVFGRGYPSATAVFSDEEVTLDTDNDNVVVYSGELATVTVTGLTSGTTYHLAVYGYNADRFCYNTASPARGSKTTTTSKDADSDITRVGGETPEIDYSMYQKASNLTTFTSASLFTFSINDSGTTDTSPTIVTAISFEITNHENLRTLALFDGTADGAELIKELEVTSNTVDFTSFLPIVAAPRSSKEVNVRATFLTNVDDGEEIGLTISDVTADASGSVFAENHGGGAATISSNQIAVAATKFAITAPGRVQVGTAFEVVVTAVDVNNNIDVAARNVTLSRATGAGTLTPVADLGPVAMVDGSHTWSDVRYDVAELLTVSVTDGTLSATEDINVWALLTSVFFSEYIEGSPGNQALEIYNGSGSEVDLSEFSISRYTDGASTATTHDLFGNLAAGEVYVIANTTSDLGIRNQADITNIFLVFTGNDAMVLSHNGVIVDFIGDNTGDPGDGWPVAGTADATANHTLVRKQSVTEGNARPLRSFGTDATDSDWIVYATDDFSYLGSHCNLPSQATSVTFGATDETSMVVNWTKGDGDNSLVVVKAVSAVDEMPVFGRGYTTATADFSAAVATLAPDNVVVYSGELATVTVTGLTSGVTYYVAVYGYNADRFCYNTALPATGSKTAIVPDATSTITRVDGGESPTPIAYFGLQNALDLEDTNSVSLFTFNINDAGTADVLPTILTAISFDITNYENLKVLALFDGDMNIAELEVAGNTVAFTELNIQAADGMMKQVNVRATFSENVDDGEQIGLTILSVTAGASGSTFAEANGGGAATVITGSADINAIEVIATELVITAPELVKIGADFDLTVRAVDGNNNLDVADRSVTLSQTTGTGLSTGESLAQVATPGTFTWDAQAGSTAEDITVTVTDNSAAPLTAVSKDIEVVDELPEFTLAGTSLTDFGSVDNGATSTVQNFTVVGENLVSNITVRAPTGFKVSLTEDSGFVSSVELTKETDGTLISAQVTVYVRFSPTSGTNGQVTVDIVLSTRGVDNQTVSVMGTEAGNPAFTVTDTPLNDFGEVNNGANSDSQMFTVSGENLTANIAVAATDGFQVSLDNTDFKALVITTADLTATNGVLASTTVYVRFSPTSGTNGKVTSNIVLRTTGADEQMVEVTGTETAVVVVPSFTVTGTLVDFGSVNNNETSVTQNFTVEGENLTDKITVRATDGFQVSLTEDSGFDASVELTKETDGTLTSAPVTVYVRFAPRSGINGQVTVDITLNTSGAAEKTVSVMGTETGNVSTITVTGTPLDDFGSVNHGETSESQSFAVVGANLTTDITVTAPDDFEVSLDDTAFTTTVDLVPDATSGAVASTTVHVRFAPILGTTGEVTGDIVLSATGADEQTVEVTGTATAAVTGIGQESLKYNISVYPNPSEEVFHITIPESFGTGEVKLVSLDGAVVQNGSIGKMKQIETSNLRRGIYLLQILNTKTVVNYRVVVK